MKKKNMEKRVKALHSGKYKQGVKKLKRDDTYCCLGVLCEINGVETQGRELPSLADLYTIDLKNPDRKLKKCYNTVIGTSDQLSELNDYGLSFKEITNIIEENYKDL
jgi:hypothetical protein